MPNSFLIVSFIIYESFSNMFMRFKQCAIIEFLTHENVSSTEIYNMLSKFYDEMTTDVRC